MGSVTKIASLKALEVRLMREEDRSRFRLMTAQSFTLPKHRTELHASTPLEEGRILASNGEIYGALRVESVGQFFGGHSVPSTAVSAVQIAPEGRGRGWGKILMNEVLAELRARGIALSVLYPTNMGFYRSLGYEIAGTYIRYQLPILASPRNPKLATIEPCQDTDAQLIRQCYRRLGESSCGLLDRSERWWQTRVLNGGADPSYRYVVRKRDHSVAGYVIYSQEPEPSGFDYSYSLICQDLVWHEPEAAETLLAFAASHMVVGVNLVWTGSVEEPLAQLMQIQRPQVRQACCWMIRLVNVREALELRGYSTAVDAVVNLNVTDVSMAENNRPIRFEVRNGRGQVAPTASASAEIDVGALAALYTGWLPAREAARIGRLQNATQAEIVALEAVFASPKPWCLDCF